MTSSSRRWPRYLNLGRVSAAARCFDIGSTITLPRRSVLRLARMPFMRVEISDINGSNAVLLASVAHRAAYPFDRHVEAMHRPVALPAVNACIESALRISTRSGPRHEAICNGQGSCPSDALGRSDRGAGRGRSPYPSRHSLRHAYPLTPRSVWPSRQLWISSQRGWINAMTAGVLGSAGSRRGERAGVNDVYAREINGIVRGK